MLGQMAQEASLPDGVLQVLPGSGAEAGHALATHPLVRKIGFTGSTEVGTTIMKLAADDIKRVSLELGGKSPNIVFADADWERAAAESPMSVFANTGQDCCARSRMFIEQSIFDGFVDQFVAATESLNIGDPTNEATQVGPMVCAGQRELSESFVTNARDAGREIRSGGDRPCERGFYLNPVVITGVETGDRAWREEIFGPVVCLRPFTDETGTGPTDGDIIWSYDMIGELDVFPHNLATGSPLIVGDTLYAADVNVIRKFHRVTGKATGVIEIKDSAFLNDLASGPGGKVYVSDTGFGGEKEPAEASAVYEIGSDDSVKALSKGAEVPMPNGLLVTADGLMVLSLIHI